MLCSQQSSFDSKPSTVMATRPHIKLVDVKGRFHMNILFVSVCDESVTGAKLCTSVFLNVWQQHQASAAP